MLKICIRLREGESVIDGVICQACDGDILHVNYYTLYLFTARHIAPQASQVVVVVAVFCFVGQVYLSGCFLIMMLT